MALAIDRPIFDVEPDVSAADLADEALARAATRDREAFAVLYRRHVSEIYRYCYRRLGTRERAEDATATTFERALAGIVTFRRGPFRAWLFTIARNATVDTYRRSTRDVPLAETYDRADETPGPEEVTAARDDAIWVRGLLAQLTGDQREVVELRLAGLTDQEIGRVLGKRHGAIRTIQHRALKRLRQLADEEIRHAQGGRRRYGERPELRRTDRPHPCPRRNPRTGPQLLPALGASSTRIRPNTKERPHVRTLSVC